jgi:NAD(P)-dependent dehydrogenase (short-subunit alcohol dehydrogenase family)
MSQNAVVTGAGTGVGRAVALALLARGWNVALIGRRSAMLDETISLAGDVGDRALTVACDVSDEQAVKAMAQSVMERFGTVDVLVNAAGTNTPERSLAVLSEENYHRMMNTNLNGVYYCVQAFLPSMRERGAGTIINIGSISGLRATPLAGVAYSMSKFGVVGLTQAINAEERNNGIRACVISPGEIDTPILELRPVFPSDEARAKMLQPEDVAACVMLVVDLPPRAIVEEMVIQPVKL